MKEANYQTQTSIDTESVQFSQTSTKGHSESVLHLSEHEKVAIEKLAPKTQVNIHARTGGYELLLLNGDLNIEGKVLSLLTWVRLPVNCSLSLETKRGCKLWTKQKHLKGV